MYSILRDAQHNHLSTLTLNGKVLDIGGVANSAHHDFIHGDFSVVTTNINESTNADLIFDAQDPFPIDDGEFDHVLCMNVLEHVFGFDNLTSEAYRCLKPGGTFNAAIPFMHHIHGSPDDYFRYTSSALRAQMEKVGFQHITITPLGHGLLSFNYQTICGAIPGRFLKKIVKKSVIGLDKFLGKCSKKYARVADRIPLGYFVEARK